MLLKVNLRCLRTRESRHRRRGLQKNWPITGIEWLILPTGWRIRLIRRIAEKGLFIYGAGALYAPEVVGGFGRITSQGLVANIGCHVCRGEGLNA